MNTHAKFKEYGGKSLEYRRKCELLLPEIFSREIWKTEGFKTIYEYAGKLAGMSSTVVDECLKIYGRIADKPALLNIAEQKGLRAVKPVAYIATLETESFWANKANDMSQHTLRTYVKEYRREFCDSKNVTKFDSPETLSVKEFKKDDDPEVVFVELTINVDKRVFSQVEKIKGAASWNDFFVKVVSNGIAKVPKAVKASSRHIPNEMQRFEKEKFNGLCHFPGCKLRGEIFHHTQRFALEKVHDPARLVYLCTEHERIVHLGLVDFEGKAPHEWRLRINADTNDYKYFVDQQVRIHRKNSVLAGG